MFVIDLRTSRDIIPCIVQILTFKNKTLRLLFKCFQYILTITVIKYSPALIENRGMALNIKALISLFKLVYLFYFMQNFYPKILCFMLGRILLIASPHISTINQILELRFNFLNVSWNYKTVKC